MIVIEYEGSKFCYTRDREGRAYWSCLSGKVPGYTGGGGVGIIVPAYIAHILDRKAISEGHVLNQKSNKNDSEEKSDSSRIKVKSAAKSKMKSAINPFKKLIEKEVADSQKKE